MDRAKHEDISFEVPASSVRVVSRLMKWDGRRHVSVKPLTNKYLLQDFLWHPEANNSMKERLMSWTQVSGGLVSSEGL